MGGTEEKYENLALGGGGPLGIAYVGAFERLHARGILGNLRNFAGTSVGALFAAALACRASYDFIVQELASLDVMSLLDYSNKAVAIYNFYFYHGFCPGTVLLSWCENFIEKLTGDKEITLRQIHDRFGGRLVIPGYRLPDADGEGGVELFDYTTQPDMPLKIALRISTSMPIIFMPVEWHGRYYVDAGRKYNYPISVFHEQTISGDIIQPATLGIMLCNKSVSSIDINNIYNYVYVIMSYLFNQDQAAVLEPQDFARTIRINCDRYSSLDFSISEEDKQRLIECGRKAVDEFFDRNILAMAQYIRYRATDDASTCIDSAHEN